MTAGAVGCNKEDINMAEPRFIKTVTFGGYEKEAVVRRIDALIKELREECKEA